ncbi:MAG: TrkH family potassium uptake protein [Clostridium sp.]
MKRERSKRRIRLKPVQILALGFATVILIGACLLSLPIASANGTSTNFLDSIFTSTSAVCVTGLVVVDTGTHWSYFGKNVIIMLIEIGGLGFMSFATLIFLVLGKKITLKERLVMQEAMNSFYLQGIVKMARYILGFTFSVQAVGAMLLSTQFIPEFGIRKGIYYSIFHSISAFCNAGFDLMGNFQSVTAYANNPVVILTLATLIVIGGLGFCVWIEIYNYRKNKKLSLNSKVVLMMTTMLIVGGAMLMFLFEMKNPATLNGRPMREQFLSATFAAISPRTAGFNSISLSDMTLAGKFLSIVLMFIGGGSGSTAGGLKVTTVGILIVAVISVIRGREDAEIFKKRLSKELVYKAFVIFTISLLLVISVTMILSIVEPQAPLEALLFEATSAYATVGSSLGLSPELGFVGKIIISLTMYAGRVGPMTLALALGKRGSRNVAIKYPEDKILVG